MRRWCQPASVGRSCLWLLRSIRREKADWIGSENTHWRWSPARVEWSKSPARQADVVFSAQPLQDGDPRGYRQSVFKNGYLVPNHNWNRSENARRWLPEKVSLPLTTDVQNLRHSIAHPAEWFPILYSVNNGRIPISRTFEVPPKCDI